MTVTVSVKAEGGNAVHGARRGRVLIVDDEAVLANTLRRLLDVEHDVTVVHTAEEALALVAAGRRFDLILSDLMLPLMDGMELHARLQRTAADQAAAMVFMTGGAFTSLARAFLDAMPNRHVEKPFGASLILGMVNERVRAG
jgi:CheY-like chemotaxis protein